MNDDVRARRMVQGREAFERGDFFVAHELWEDEWRNLEGEKRRWLQGLIQVAAARYQLARGRVGPAARLLVRALDKLEDAPDEVDGIDVGAIREDAGRILAGLG